MVVNRHGIIHFPDALAQPHDSGIVLDGSRFMDIDLISDLKDEAWIIGELKKTNVKTDYSRGAGLSLHRLQNDLRNGRRKPTLYVEAEHNTPNSETITLYDCKVRCYSDGRFGSEGWGLPKNETLGELCEDFWKKVKENRI